MGRPPPQVFGDCPPVSLSLRPLHGLLLFINRLRKRLYGQSIMLSINLLVSSQLHFYKSLKTIHFSRGVQYVHWVMHKCIMVKVGGEITRKACKTLMNFPLTGGKCTKTGKIGGK